jgi:hypothetical protein
MGRSTKVQHHNSKVLARLQSSLRDQQRLFKKLVASNALLKAKEYALSACVDSQVIYLQTCWQCVLLLVGALLPDAHADTANLCRLDSFMIGATKGDGITGFGKVIQAVQSCLEDVEENNFLIDKIAHALSYDARVYDIMHHLSHSGSSKQSSDVEREALRTSKCLEAAWSTRSAQQLLTGPDMQQLLQQFRQLSMDLVQLSRQHNLVTQQRQCVAGITNETLPSAISKTTATTQNSLTAAIGTTDGAQSTGRSNNMVDSTTGVATLDEAVEKLLG